jgi:hypothetical protein
MSRVSPFQHQTEIEPSTRNGSHVPIRARWLCSCGAGSGNVWMDPDKARELAQAHVEASAR